MICRVLLVPLIAFIIAQPSRAEETAELALRGLDPVQLIGGKEIAGDKARTLGHKGLLYRFANDENRKSFESDPSRFAVQMDGHCGAMPKTKGDPSIFAVVKGRIYIFGTENCRTTFIADPDKFTKKRKKVAVFIHEGVELLDFAGPSEVFAAAGNGQAFDVFTVAATNAEIKSQGFLTVKPQYSIADCPKPDLIVLPGGSTRIPLRDEKVIEWIRKSSPDAEIVMSVCTGAFLLAKAGLLEDKEATTHWASIDGLKKAAPKTKVHADRRIVDNGKIITTAGVSAGIDGALHVVERLLGTDSAKQTARYMEYRWEPAAKKP